MSRLDELNAALTTVESIRADLRALIERVDATRLPGKHDDMCESSHLRLDDAESDLDDIIDALVEEINTPVITQPSLTMRFEVVWDRNTSAPVEGSRPCIEFLEMSPEHEWYDENGDLVDSDPSQCKPWKDYLRDVVFPALRAAGFEVVPG